jgi:predicted neuraminidase
MLALLTPAALLAAQPFLESQLVFPPEKLHNHGSSIVELPGGDLFVSWYNGSGERTADDVKIEGARFRKGSRQWGRRATIADTPEFPDCNAALLVDSQRRMWLFWPMIIANQWHTALLRYKVAPQFDDMPVWDTNEVAMFKPRNFAQKVRELAGGNPEAVRRAEDKYFSRMGWMPRARPVELPSGRIIVPLYSDGYGFSLMGITDDRGATWTTSEPLVSRGGVQPTLARKRDATLVAYMRDNGPPPKRVLESESKDEGATWSPVRDTQIPNPGSGLEVINLNDGSWLLINNDTEKGRGSLLVSISDDEGKTWRWNRHIERGEGSYHYPSVIQASDGTLHASYSHFTAEGKSIKHAHFNIDWVKAK